MRGDNVPRCVIVHLQPGAPVHAAVTVAVAVCDAAVRAPARRNAASGGHARRRSGAVQL
jgi:hypothetical protein